MINIINLCKPDIAEVILEIDKNLVVKKIWSSNEDIASLSFQEELNHPIDECLPLNFAISLNQWVSQAMFTGEPVMREYLLTEEDPPIWIYIKLTPTKNMQDSSFSSIYVVIKNITLLKKSQLSLIESEKRYQTIVESQTELICRWSTDFVLTFVNTAYCLFFGRAKKEMLSACWLDFIPTDQRENVRSFYEKLIKEKASHTYEHEVLSAEGERIWLRWKDTPFLNHTGEVDEIQSIGWDITERKKLENELEKTKEQMEFMLDNIKGIVVWSYSLIDRKLIYTNREAEILYEKPLQYFYDNADYYSIFIHPEDMENFNQKDKKLYAEGFIEIEYRILLHNEKIKWVRDRIFLTRDEKGNPVRLDGFSLDISHDKEVEDLFKKNNEELEIACEAKDKLISIVSHELKSPLTSILTFTDLLSRGKYGKLGEEQQKAVNNIEICGKHLLETVNMILRFSRNQEVKEDIKLKEVNVNNLCNTILTMTKETAHAKEIEMYCEISSQDIIIRSDEFKIKQILINLVSNAIKFTPAGGKCGIRVNVVHDYEIEFEVWDTGIGIREEDLERIFEPFVQLETNLKKRLAGSGLGLPLVQQLVQFLGGSIDVNSVLGQGSQFKIILPVDTFF